MRELRELEAKEEKAARAAEKEKLQPWPMAEAFAECFSEDRKFDHASQQWMRWDDSASHWRFDRVSETVRDIQQFVIGYSNKDGINSAARKQVWWSRFSRDVEAYCRAHPALRVHLADRQVPAHLIQTPGGMIDLRTGETVPPDKSLLNTLCTTVAPKRPPDGNIYQTRFGHFLREIFHGNEEIIDHVHTWLGYSCTAEIEVEKLHYWLGQKGANGKSKLADTLMHTLGDYAAQMSADALKHAYGQKHPTDLAVLENKRMVFAPECQGGSWDIALLKSLTGDASVTARLMRQDSRTFPRTFKLIVTGNKLPTLKDVDSAIKRRFWVLRFDRQFSEFEADEQLLKKLKADAEYVLWWVIQGAVKWHENRLANIPAAIRTATSEYMESEDLPKQWLDECCILGESRVETAKTLFRSYADWMSDQNAGRGMSKKSFGTWLGQRGFTQERTGGQRLWRGLECMDSQ